MGKSDETKKAIKDALLKCMEEIPFEKINVSQICDQADISRKTFYYHFQDKSHLLRWICLQDLFEWVHTAAVDGPSGYVDLVRFFVEKNRILYGYALQDMSPGGFGQLYSDAMYYLLSSRLECFYREVLDNEDQIALSLSLSAERGRLITIWWLLDPGEPSADELMEYLFREQWVQIQVIGRWLIKAFKGGERLVADWQPLGEEDYKKMIHSFSMKDILCELIEDYNGGCPTTKARVRSNIERQLRRI